MPRWLADRMTQLGAVISEAIIYYYGRDEMLCRLAHPFWFGSFGAMMGMDWHSSGITTSVIGALKRGLALLEKELGLHVWRPRQILARKSAAVGFRATAGGSRSSSDLSSVTGLFLVSAVSALDTDFPADTTGGIPINCDQVLVVTSGSGMVATEREQPQINVGDVVHIKADERHWHGAKADTTMGHTTITAVGGTVNLAST